MQSAFRHEPGAHCGSTALRNLSDHYGWGYDEPACFGLGAGIGFSSVDRGPADRILMCRSSHLESAFFAHLGVDVTRTAGQDRDAAWAALADRVAAGPVLAFVDLGYLPYFDTDTHFGPHTVLVTALDEDAVTVSDSEFDAVQRVERAAFDAAWTSEQGFGPLDREWLAVDDPERTVSDTAATDAAIDSAVDTMRDGGDGWGGTGVGGIADLAAALPAWTDLPDPVWTARFAYETIERRGTGGGAFRRLYADFLAGLGVDAGLEPGLATRTREIADQWTALAASLKAASEADSVADRASHFETAADQASDIAAAERTLFADLADAA